MIDFTYLLKQVRKRRENGYKTAQLISVVVNRDAFRHERAAFMLKSLRTQVEAKQEFRESRKN